jgi:transposase
LAYKQGNRHQTDLFPQSIEGYVQENDPVRISDAFVELLSMEEIEINCNKIGNSQYDPKAMLKLLIYGYSYGWRSSRKLERALYHNVSFIWLMGGLKPDYKKR